MTVYRNMANQDQNNDIVSEAEELYRQGETEKAFQLVSGTDFNDDIAALRVRSDYYNISGQTEERIKVLEHILELRPNDPLSHFLLGISYYRVGDFKNSVFHYEAAEKIWPKHPTILSGLPLAREKLKEASTT